jgi:transposase-like protein
MLAACGIGRLSHFLRNVPDYVPRRVDCLQELGCLYDRRDLPEARRDLAAWLTKWAANIPSSPAGSK